MTREDSPSFTRRGFCSRFFGLGLAALVARPKGALAQADEKVEEGEAAALSLGYRHEASQVDTDAFPKRAGAQGARQFCDSCALFEGEPGDRWAPCSIFQRRLVAGKGWCNAWVSRT